MLSVGVFRAAGYTAHAILDVLAVVGNEVGWELDRKGHCDGWFDEIFEYV